MAETTNIGWTDSTWNPWIGCTKVNLDCKNCYAETMDEQRFQFTLGGASKAKPIRHWGFGAPRYLTKDWSKVIAWNKKAEHLGRPQTVFPSLCDWLDREVPLQWFFDLLMLIQKTPWLRWLLLTKRPGQFRQRMDETYNKYHPDFVRYWLAGEPPKHVWLGVSAGSQEYAEEMIPELLRTPAALRFLSIEPLRSNVDLRRLSADDSMDVHYNCLSGESCWSIHTDRGPKIGWVIVGGESGSDRRDCGVDNIVFVAEQAIKERVPLFVKQDSAFHSGEQGRIPDHIWAYKQIPPLLPLSA